VIDHLKRKIVEGENENEDVLHFLRIMCNDESFTIKLNSVYVDLSVLNQLCWIEWIPMWENSYIWDAQKLCADHIEHIQYSSI